MQITKMKMNEINLSLNYQSISSIKLHKEHPILVGNTVKNYQKVLSYSNLKLHDQISHRNVKIYQNQYIHQIYTKSNSNLPHLIFLHGFGGTSMTAIRMFEHIHTYFQVHALDSFGFGYSSRGKFSQKFTYEQVRDYYIHAIQQWRKALNIQKFYLVAHSFGGYIAAWYTASYPQRVQHLFLVSPAGAGQRRNLAQGGQITCRTKMFLSIGQKVYNCNIRPSKAMTNFFIGKRMVNSILINRLKIPENQQQDWRQYFNNVNSQQQSSEVGFYKMFTWPLKAVVPIDQMIRKNMLPVGIDFYFGDEDWMPHDGVQAILKQKFQNIQMTIIPKSGHQIVFDNSKYLCQCIVNRVKSFNQKNNKD